MYDPYLFCLFLIGNSTSGLRDLVSRCVYSWVSIQTFQGIWLCPPNKPVFLWMWLYTDTLKILDSFVLLFQEAYRLQLKNISFLEWLQNLKTFSAKGYLPQSVSHGLIIFNLWAVILSVFLTPKVQFTCCCSTSFWVAPSSSDFSQFSVFICPVSSCIFLLFYWLTYN